VDPVGLHPPLYQFKKKLLLAEGGCIYPWFNICFRSAPQVEFGIQAYLSARKD
jgi:hypothetical protein